MASLFGSAAPGPTAISLESIQAGRPNNAPTRSAAELDKLISDAAHDLSEYQRLTSEGKLGEAGQKLEELKRALDALSHHGK
jgi:septation ring formation regulator EzrA